MMRILVLVLTMHCCSSVYAESGKPVSECTKEYITELRDDLEANKEMRKWTTNHIRTACRVINRTEDIAGSLFGAIGLDNVFKSWFPSVDPKLVSNICKYVRKKGEELLTPEKDEERIRAELKRCSAE